MSLNRKIKTINLANKLSTEDHLLLTLLVVMQSTSLQLPLTNDKQLPLTNENRTKVYSINGQDIQLQFNEPCTLVAKELGEGCAGTHAVELLLKKPSIGTDKTVVSSLSPNIVKIQEFSGFAKEMRYRGEEADMEKHWQAYQSAKLHEVEMLKIVQNLSDDEGNIVYINEGKHIKEGKHIIATSMPKAEGVPLNVYLAANPNLSFDERLAIIHRVNAEVRQLHDHHRVAHLDLKLENIFYDATNQKITLIDFGSAAKVGTTITPKNTDLHKTTIHFDPCARQTNKPDQIDAFSLAGVYGLILSDWHDVTDTEWTKLPVMSFKQSKYGMIPDVPERRQYNFEGIMQFPQHAEQRAEVIGLLNGLGNTDKDKRISLEDLAKSSGLTKDLIVETSKKPNIEEKKSVEKPRTDPATRKAFDKRVQPKLDAKQPPSDPGPVSIAIKGQIEKLLAKKIFASSKPSIQVFKKSIEDTSQLTENALILSLNKIILEIARKQKRFFIPIGSKKLIAILNTFDQKLLDKLPEEGRVALHRYSKNVIMRFFTRPRNDDAFKKNTDALSSEAENPKLGRNTPRAA